MAGFPLDDASQENDGVEPAGTAQQLSRQGKFETPRHVNGFDILFRHAVRDERFHGAAEEGLCDFRVPLGNGNAETHAFNGRKCTSADF